MPSKKIISILTTPVFFLSLVGGVLAPVVAVAQNTVGGFGGKVVSVNASANSFQAEVRAVYAGAQGQGGLGAVLPKGKIVTVNVPAGTPIVNPQNKPITLSQVQPGALFNANIIYDTTTKVVTATKVVFTKVPPPLPKPPPYATSTLNVAVVGFAGTVVSVNVSASNFLAKVQIIYAGAQNRGGLGGVLPAGKIVTIKVSSTTQLVNFKGQKITLAQVQPNVPFNATVWVDTAVKTITAQKIQFKAPTAETHQQFSEWPSEVEAAAIAFAATTTGTTTDRGGRGRVGPNLLRFGCGRVANVFEMTLDRLDAIIIKQESAIKELKTQGKNTVAAEQALAKSKTDLGLARTAVQNSKTKCAALEQATTGKEQAARAARQALNDAQKAINKVLHDTQATQKAIRAVREKSKTGTTTNL